MGDGALVEFASVAEAVSCAIAIQNSIVRSTADDIKLRIGINLGDVISSGDDIYGDGVNIAARLEGIADPGGICISGIVHQSLGSPNSGMFHDLGPQSLKNVTAPVNVFAWHPEKHAHQASANRAPISDEGKASIAVLAFDNMSTDPEQEYFSDGIAEDIITALSHFRDFFVIARNTSFTYKGKPVRVDQVCRDLSVRYVLEGSVRKAGSRIRVTAQLIEGKTGAHLWADRFDRDLTDVFAVQDEITQSIVTAVAPETMGAETRRARSKRPENLSAWDLVLRARWHLGQFNRADNETATRLLNQSLATEPDDSVTHATLALCHLMAMLHYWRTDTSAEIKLAQQSAEKAVQLDSNNAHAHAILGMSESFARNFEAAEKHLLRSIDLNPNLAMGHGNITAYYGVSGDYDKAKSAYECAVALSPRDPLKPFWRGGFGAAIFLSGAYEECLENAREGLRETPGFASLMRQEAAALGMLESGDNAKQSVQRLLTAMPGLTVTTVRHIVPIRYPDDHERWLEGLRRAGLPE
ncbi:adenylate/guanylate cyclase domain-containing protein [Falsiphaeobacter marinintestinus]|uniref:adenylate/guanylate cyclase domain-containing protein n=1 Tax=Falsiphaeobacter marinintestinus TaxID=1492905 RepID=UPI001FE9AB00|nr:adenylate/guanylate cyclase domain-containing protein [Phaeobacter marinintestinus]